MKGHKIAWALLIILVLFEVAIFKTYGRKLVVKSINSSCFIVAESLEVFWDEGATQIVENVEWGRLRPGENGTILIWIQNQGNEPANITIWTSDWNPLEASNFVLITWDYQGQVLQVDEILAVNVILQVSPEIQGINGFNFNIGIGIGSIYG